MAGNHNQHVIGVLSATIGVLGPIVFTILTIFNQLRTATYDWISQTISELALYRGGWGEAIALSVLGVAIVSLSFVYYFNMQKSRATKTAAILVIAIGLGFVITGISPTDYFGSPITVHSEIHRWTARMIAALYPFACFLLAYSFRTDSRLKGLFLYTILSGIIGFAADIIAVVCPENLLHPYSGVYERILALNGLAFFGLMASRFLVISIRNLRIQARKNDTDTV